MRRGGLSAVVLVLAAMFVLSGCIGSVTAPTLRSDETANTFATICADAMVASCSITPEYSCGRGQDLDDDNKNDDYHDPLVCGKGTPAVEIAVAEAASEGDVMTLARELYDQATAASFTGSATMRREIDAPIPQVLDTDRYDLWRVEVYPGDWATGEKRVRGVVDAAAIPGTFAISIDPDGWPSLTVADLAQFGGTFDQISALPLFADGATYVLYAAEEHLKIVHVPERTSDYGIHQIVDLATEFPGAEMLLQAPTAGPQWPEFYASELTEEEAARMVARLTDPAMAKMDVDGYPVGYIVRDPGDEGSGYITGNFGNVPSE